MPDSKPRWTQSMSMHLNGGSKFSELRFRVYMDGQETNITRVTRTSGSPQYLKTIDQLGCGEDVFDILATRGAGMEAWLDAHAPSPQSSIAPGDDGLDKAPGPGDAPSGGGTA